MSETGWSRREAEILGARTRALAKPVRQPELKHEELETVLVQVSGETLGIETPAVHGVTKLDRMAPLPHSPSHIAGLVSHAGAILPVFHFRAVLDLPLVVLAEHSRALLIGRSEPEMALVVDQVLGVRSIDLETLRPPPETISRAARDLVRGVDASGVPIVGARALLESERLYVDIQMKRGES